MGVHGLWRLIEPSGRPVPLETLENKVLAVDISIWLHQAVKGFQDSKGASVPNAHLLGIYHRLCKLLYFRIKPVFVFDGGVPALKKQTIAKRTQSKLRNISKADRIQRQLLDTLLKHTAINKVLAEHIEASMSTLPKLSERSTKEDMYKLPTTELDSSTISSSEDESYSETTTDSSPTKNWDLHTIDMGSVHFKKLPVDVRHEILTDLKETRKQSSWGRLHELPKVSDDFSDYQMKRLLKRQAVQTALEEAEKEMGGKSLSLAELESLLKDQGVISNSNLGSRIASDETTKYLLVKDVKKAIEEARKKQLDVDNQANLIVTEEEVDANSKTIADIEYEDDLKKAIALSLECEPSTSHDNVTQPVANSFIENFADADFASSSSDEESSIVEQKKGKMASAESYMLEYSGLTPNEIAKIVNQNRANSRKTTLPTLAEVADESDNMDSVKIMYTSSNIEQKKGKMASAKSSMLEYSKLTPNEIAKVVNQNEANSKKTTLTLAKIAKESENIDLVEIMSTSSSDNEGTEKLTQMNIVINPNSEFNENDDLFADIFNTQPSKQAVSNQVVPVTDISSKQCNDDSNKVLLNNKDQNAVNSDIEESIQAVPLDNKVQKSIEEEISSISRKEPVEVDEETRVDLSLEDEPDQQKLAKINEKTKIVLSEQENNELTEKRPVEKPLISEQELRGLQQQLQKDSVDLLAEKSTKERIAGNITDQMYMEAQELLELFGVPYVVAPMEAEAQCAFLDAIELTDGTITDDSDIWLFGGKTVYKNFFNQSKYVMEFRSESIEHHFKLTREQMILLALLVGSDYTDGLQGVGPVTAMEILAAFPPGKGKLNEFTVSQTELISGLKEFRSWFTKGKSAGPGRSALKSKLKNVAFTENFPSTQVVEAYLDPKVETSREAFSWGRPNTAALLEFAREKFGWTKTKTDEILNPVLKKLDESKHQKSIRDYFKTRFRIHSAEAENKMSKRVKSAISNMGRDSSEILAEELQEELKKQPKKKLSTRRKKEVTEAPEFASKPKKESHMEANLDAELVDDISDKIGIIRRRRKVKEAKAAVDIKKPKVVKETKPAGDIPKELRADEEVRLLEDIVTQSNKKVEDINKTVQETLRKLKPIMGSSFGTSVESQPSTSSRLPTRIPKKEVIPQKEKDKTVLLRSKLKAIEVFRKGKQGPGYVPKRAKKKRAAKEEAQLSESSDE